MTRKGFGKGLLSAGSKHKDLFVLTADLGSSTCTTPFAKKYSERFLDVGVAEQSLASVSAGLALEGSHVVMTSFAVFNPGRNWDFLRTQIMMNNLPVIIVGAHAGLATGEDGATHQALEDVALMRSFPNITIISPCDDHESSLAIAYALQLKTPVYLRLARQTPAELTKKLLKEFTGKPLTLKKGTDALILTTGVMASTALQATTLLEKQGFNVGVTHIPIIKPFKPPAIKKEALVFTLEDHSIIGGLGSAACEHAATTGFTVHRLGATTFGTSAPANQAYEWAGLDPQSVATNIARVLQKHKNYKLVSKKGVKKQSKVKGNGRTSSTRKKANKK